MCVCVHICICVCVCVCEGQRKSSLADQYMFMECDKISFIFEHSPPYASHTSSIGVAVHGHYW